MVFCAQHKSNTVAHAGAFEGIAGYSQSGDDAGDGLFSVRNEFAADVVDRNPNSDAAGCIRSLKMGVANGTLAIVGTSMTNLTRIVSLSDARIAGSYEVDLG